MKLSILIFLGGILFSETLSATNTVFFSHKDTIRAGVMLRKADNFDNNAVYDSAIYYYQLSSSEYLRSGAYENYLRCRNNIITSKRKRGVTSGLLEEAWSNLEFAKNKLKKSSQVKGDCYSILGNIYADDINLDSALFYFNKAIIVWKENPPVDDIRIANGFRNLGTVYSDKGLMDSARIDIMKSIEIRKKSSGEESASLASDFNILGVIDYYQAQWDSCQFYFGKIVAIREKTLGVDHPITAEAYNNLAALFMEKAMYDTALVLNKKALAIRLAKLPENHPNIALSLNNIGNIYRALGNFEAALDYHNRALAIRQKIYPNNDSPDISMSYTNLGVICLDMGRYREALGYFLLSLEIQSRVYGPESPNTASAYNNVGAVYDNLGEYDKSYNYLLKGLSIRKKRGYTAGVATSYNNIGTSFKEKGDYDLALAYYSKSLEIVKSLTDSKLFPSIAGKLRNIGSVYLIKGMKDTALVCFKKALETDSLVFGIESPELISDFLNRGAAFGELKMFPEEMKDYRHGLNLVLKTFGNIHPETGNFYSGISRNFMDRGIKDSAICYMRSALQIKQKIYPFNHPEVAIAWREMGETFEKAGISDSARFAYEKSLNAGYSPVNRQIIDEPEFAATLLDLCRLNCSDFKSKANVQYLKDNVSYFSQVENISQKVITGFLLEETKINLLNRISGYDIYAIDAAYRLYRQTGSLEYFLKALEFSEVNKASVLQNLANQYAGRNGDRGFDSLLVSRNNLLGYVNYLQMKLHNRKFAANFTEEQVKNSYDSVLISLGIINDSINSYNKTSGLQYVKEGSLLLKNIRAKLDPGSALISYSLNDSLLYTFVITGESYAVKKRIISPSGHLKSLVEEYLTDLKKFRKEKVSELGSELYKLLISDIQENIRDKKSLVIIPDKYLLYLPFETLTSSSAAVKSFSDFRDQPYLIKKFDISYHYSAGMWSSENEKNNMKLKNLLAFAPVFGKGSGPSDNINDKVSRENMSELPFSHAEIDSLKLLCNRYGIKADTFTYLNATEGSLKQHIGDYRFIHLATHQVMDQKSHDFTGLVFSDFSPSVLDEPDSARANDGILYSKELYQLKIKADLVTLSACETGIGRLEEGEGVIGLVRGFLYSGASNVLFSFWKVGDKNTMLFMKEFYRNIFEGDSYPAALRKVKLEMIKNPETSFPLVWGGFSIIGRPVEGR
jgi:Uncharacterized protein conserved in bacteria